MRMFQCLALAAVLLSGQAAEAAATRYECEFDVGHRRDGNWVPSVLVVQHEDGAPTATIYDPIIKHTLGKPIEGRVGDTSDVRTSFTWSMKMHSKSKQPVRMDYTFTYYNNGTPAKVIVTPAGFDNHFSGNGTCKLTRG